MELGYMMVGGRGVYGGREKEYLVMGKRMKEDVEFGVG